MVSECAGSPGPRSSSRSSASRPRSLRGATRRAGSRLCSSRSSPRRWWGRSCAAGSAPPARASALARRSAGRRCFATSLLAAGFAVLPSLPERSLSTEQWLGVGIVLALLLCLGLGVAVLALAREVGMLRLRLGPAAALEIPEEGPELGERLALIDRFAGVGERALALAVFTSEGCRVCRSLEPAIATLADHPAVAVEVFDEVADSDVWSELRDPRQPVLDRARPGRDRALQGDLQQPGPARERPRHRGGASRGTRGRELAEGGEGPNRRGARLPGGGDVAARVSWRGPVPRWWPAPPEDWSRRS